MKTKEVAVAIARFLTARVCVCYVVLVLLTFVFGCASKSIALRGYEDYKLSSLKQFSGPKEIDLEVLEDKLKIAPYLQDALSEHFSITPGARYRVAVVYDAIRTANYEGPFTGGLKPTGEVDVTGRAYIFDRVNKEMLKLNYLFFSNTKTPGTQVLSTPYYFAVADRPLQAFLDTVVSMILHSFKP
jgi:hypothetical protein